MDRPSVFKLEGDASTATDMSTNAPSILAINGVFCTLTVIVGVLRIYVRSVMLKTFGTDDWFILAAIVSYHLFVTNYSLHHLLGSGILVLVQVQFTFTSRWAQGSLWVNSRRAFQVTSESLHFGHFRQIINPDLEIKLNLQTRNEVLYCSIIVQLFCKRQRADLTQDMRCWYLYLLYWTNKTRTRDAYGFHIYRRNDQVETLAVFPFNNCHRRNIIHQDFRRIVSTPFGAWKGI